MDMEGMLEDLGWKNKPGQSECPLTVKDEPIEKFSKSVTPVDNQKPSTSKEGPALIKTEGSKTRCESVVTPVDSVQPGPSQAKPVQVNLPKRRGRPARGALKNEKPTRKSKRVKKCPKVMQYNHNLRPRRLWSEKDKKALLAGLEEYGPNNAKLLMEYLPNKTENEINNQIRMWRNFAQTDLEMKLVSEKKQTDSATVNSVAKLNDWIDHCEALTKVSSIPPFALTNVFAFIAEFGDFPEPEQCDGIDLRSMYRYLNSLVNGQPFHGLKPTSARVLNDSISHLFKIIREVNRVKCLQSVLYSHGAHERLPVPVKNYSRNANRGVNIPTAPEAIMNLPVINPLHLPPHSLVKPVTEEQDFDDDEFDEELLTQSSASFREA